MTLLQEGVKLEEAGVTISIGGELDKFLAVFDPVKARLAAAEENLVFASSRNLLLLGNRTLDVVEEMAKNLSGSALARPLMQYTNCVKTGGIFFEEVPDVRLLLNQIKPNMLMNVPPDKLVVVQPLGDNVPVEVGQSDGQPLVVEIQPITFREVFLPKRELHPEAPQMRLNDPLVLIPEWADQELLNFLTECRKIFALQMLTGKIDLGKLDQSAKNQRLHWQKFISRTLGMNIERQLPGLESLIRLTTFSELLAAAMVKARLVY